jgi:glycosyltransferase involved in cell wall biosynthesis
MALRSREPARAPLEVPRADRVKLIIQMPCYNEGGTLRRALETLPRKLSGVDDIEILIIDDGSTDDTLQVAKDFGVQHIVSHVGNRGLAAAFMTGLRAALARGADIIVNTDADNQYDAADIPKLIAPILEGRAEFVIGARPIADTEHFSRTKKALQRLGSAVVRGVSGTNEDLRPSRLVRSIGDYVRRSIVTIGHVFLIYRPFKFFGLIGAVFFGAGLVLGIRYLYLFAIGEGSGHVQSVILMAILLLMGFHTFSLAIVAHLISVNRRLMEEIQVGVREMQLERDDRR